MVFTFSGKLTKRIAADAIQEWETAFQKDKSGGICFVWDCTKMTGWTSSARVMWQKCLRRHKVKIRRIYLITTSTKIKAGAQLITTFTSYPIKLVPSIEAASEKINQ